MKISIQLQQDNGTIVREVTKTVPQTALDRVVAAMRAEFGGMEGTGPDVFEFWANEVFQDMKGKVSRHEAREAAKNNPVKDMF